MQLVHAPRQFASSLPSHSSPVSRTLSPQFVAQIVVIFAVLGITLALMLVTGPVMRIVGVTGGAVLGRLLGVLLAALASQFVMDGIRGAMSATTP